ncbi:hypothetical protein JMUB7545_27800 [Staphylococcus aureus]
MCIRDRYKSANSIPFPFTIKFLFIGFMNFLCNIKSVSYTHLTLPTTERV